MEISRDELVREIKKEQRKAQRDYATIMCLVKEMQEKGIVGESDVTILEEMAAEDCKPYWRFAKPNQ